jgi:D-3-phosphoglycerate dehydrogenase
MRTVLVNKPIHPDALTHLETEVQVLAPYSASDMQVLDLLPQADGIILSGTLSIGAEAMDRCPKLQVIGRHGVGLDTVDMDAATQRNLPVVYTPYGPTESTAEHALLLMLAAARHLPLLDRATRAGRFAIRSQLDAMGQELKGKALGVIGFGRIGRRLAEMCRDALHMSIYVFDPFIDDGTVASWGGTLVQDILDLAREVDVISVHTPLTTETHHLVNRDVLRAMRPGSILVNASRGPVVDEQALLEALQEGHLAGAGLDVFDPEPPAPENPLLHLEQVVVTPHVGSFTAEGRRLMGVTVAEDVLRVLRNEFPRYLANPQVWDHRRTGFAQ